MEYTETNTRLVLLLHRALWNNSDYHTNKCTTETLLFYKSHVKHIKTFEGSYMFRSLDHLQGAHIVPG
jgi:hypothetical protein